MMVLGPVPVGVVFAVIVFAAIFALDVRARARRRREVDAQRDAEHVVVDPVDFRSALRPVGGWRATLPVVIETPQDHERIGL